MRFLSFSQTLSFLLCLDVLELCWESDVVEVFQLHTLEQILQVFQVGFFRVDKKSISQTSSLLLLLQSSSWLIGPILFNFSISYFGESVESLRRILCIILCCASIPSLLSILILLKSYNSILYVPLMTNDEETEVAVEITESSRPQSLFISFVGTGITWFLYDYNVST